MRRSLVAGAMAIAALYLMSPGGLAEEKKAEPGTPFPPVVAKVNGKAITARAYQKQWDQAVMEMGGPGAIQDPEVQEAVKHNVLERVITLELLVQKTDQMNVQADPEEVKKKVLELEARFGGKEALDQALQAWRISREEYVADLENTLRIRRLLQVEVTDKITLGPEEVKDFYVSNPKVFEKPAEVRARHIVIRVPQGATDQERKEAREAIEKAAERIRKGEPFETVAKEVSQDATASEGGDLGYFSRGKMAPQLAEAAFAMDKGEVSPVTETPLGYHLVKVEDKRPPGIIPFEEAEPLIRVYLRREKQEERLREYMEGLRAEATIERSAF